MSQSPTLYDTSPALALLDPWLRAHLPSLDEAVVRRFSQLVAGIFEQRSLLLETIAQSSAFRASDSSNTTQVRRIIRDARLTPISAVSRWRAEDASDMVGGIVNRPAASGRVHRRSGAPRGMLEPRRI